jgi:hypothetical protein
MDPIWLCVTTILLHVLINRLFGRLPGWPRLAHWPAMQIAAMSVHALLASAPISWLLQWSSPLTGLTAHAADGYASLLAAVAAALVVRRRTRDRLLPA